MKVSAGILLEKFESKDKKFLLVHPGGGFFKNKDDGYWSIPKGEVESLNQSELETIKKFITDKNSLPESIWVKIKQTAIREFSEETGYSLQDPSKIEFKDVIKRKDGKIIFCFSSKESIPDSFTFKSMQISIVWPKKSGNNYSFPECDKIEWFNAVDAHTKIQIPQRKFIDLANVE